jgi:hypothetical protein
MTESVDEAAAILRDYREHGWKSQPYERTYALAANHPDQLVALLHRAVADLHLDVTFLDAALSFLPAEAFPDLVTAALDALQAGPHDFAASVLAYASLQQLSALHPHLARIEALRPNAEAYYAAWPWRESGTLAFEALRAQVEDPWAAPEARLQAWQRLLETRDPEALRWAALATSRPNIPGEFLQEFAEIGYQRRDDGVRRLYPERVYHLAFDAEYRGRQSRPFWLQRTHHPTWQLDTPAHSLRFGGRSAAECAACGGAPHHLVTLDPVPDGIGVSGLERLELAACLSCLGWTEHNLFYRHAADGTPSPTAYTGERQEPDFVIAPLLETRVGLAETPPRWKWQDWGLSNGRENLNRVGGPPCWIQSADYPNCPDCGQQMPLLLQLDSELETEDGDFMWGTGGIGYACWCDNCKISGYLWQCT